MIKLKNKAGNDVYFNVLNIISITDRKGGVLIKTSNPACNVEVKESIDAVIAKVEKMLIFLGGNNVQTVNQ